MSQKAIRILVLCGGAGGGVDNGQTQDNSDGQVPPQRCPEAGPGFFSLH